MYLFRIEKDDRTYEVVISDIENMINDKDEKTKTFISKSQKIHGFRYDYSQVIYTTSRTKVAIICHQHKIHMGKISIITMKLIMYQVKNMLKFCAQFHHTIIFFKVHTTMSSLVLKVGVQNVHHY